MNHSKILFARVNFPAEKAGLFLHSVLHLFRPVGPHSVVGVEVTAGNVLSLSIIIFSFLRFRSMMEAVMWHTILAGNWTGRTITDSKREAGG
jgi:hypothetical protein